MKVVGGLFSMLLPDEIEHCIKTLWDPGFLLKVIFTLYDS